MKEAIISGVSDSKPTKNEINKEVDYPQASADYKAYTLQQNQKFKGNMTQVHNLTIQNQD